MNGWKHILIIGENGNVVYHTISSILGKEFSVVEHYIVKNSDKYPNILIRWLSVMKEFRRGVIESKPDKIIICGGPLISVWLIVALIVLFRLKIELILFRYDIDHFKNTSGSMKDRLILRLERALEKFCFLNADKIIHKGSSDELSHLPFIKKIKNKPSYLFREFLDRNLIVKHSPNMKLSKKDKQLHLVYVGGWYFKDQHASSNFFDLYSVFYKNGMHVHVYCKVSVSSEQETMRSFEKKFPFFHYEGSLNHDKLIKEISKYDYGLNYYGFLDGSSNIYTTTSFSNKSQDYIAAGLPIIVNSEAKAISEFVKNNGIGIVHPLKVRNAAYLKGEMTKNHKEYIRNIQSYIKNFSEKKFMDFIKIPTRND